MLLPVIEIYKKLFNHFGCQHWWPANNDYEMLIGAILTQNTNWKNVEKALHNLGTPLNFKTILNTHITTLAELIKPSGYYNQKAQRILSFTRWMNDNFHTIMVNKTNNGLREKLLGLKGIGPETADCMLVYAFGKPVFIIDAYTRRLFSRLGYVVPKSYDVFRLHIETALGNDFTLEICNEFHALIVKQAKCFCKSKPECNQCPLNNHCVYHNNSFYPNRIKRVITMS